MSLRIEQTARYLGKDRWAWTVRLAGPADALAAVSRVSWHLHPSFTPSVVEVSDPRDGFALSSSGWGTFELRALLKLHSGAETELRHELALFYPDTDGDPALERESPRRAVPRSRAGARDAGPQSVATPGRHAGGPSGGAVSPGQVYLSYGSEDRSRALQISRLIESLGASVVDGSRLPPGAPWQRAVHEAIAQSQGVVALVSSELPSQWVAEELALAQRLDKPLLLLTLPGMTRIMGLDMGRSMRLVAHDDLTAVQAALAQFLKA